MRENLLHYATPSHRRPIRYREPASFGRLNAVAAGLVAFVLLWYVAIVAAGHTDRQIAGPAFALSFVTCVYGLLRLRSTSLLVRLLCFPVWLVIGTLVFALSKSA